MKGCRIGDYQAIASRLAHEHKNSRKSHADTSMFFTGMKFRRNKVNKIHTISNASEC